MDQQKRKKSKKKPSKSKKSSSSSSSSNQKPKKTSNWDAFKKKQSSSSSSSSSTTKFSKKRKRPDQHNTNSNGSTSDHRYKDKRSGAQRRKAPRPPSSSSSASSSATAVSDHHLYVACDCEMVGVGPSDRSELARVSLTDWSGKTVYDKFVKPRGKVTNYRTWVSGIRKRDLIDALPFFRAQKEVLKLLKGKILVGHALDNDLKSLDIEHPEEMIRDTARYPPLLKRNAATGKRQPRKLKDLAERIGDVIQTGSHSSVEDAVASMKVYQHYKSNWDKWLATGILPGTVMFEASTNSIAGKTKKRKTGVDPFASKFKKRKMLEK